ncbi:hypothetical protein C8J34_102303 [Rhizobium sp. PP-F2F-G36]|nr:hypothetical protein C8J34_102303 [Rhizobium sp. PP-F2F-G36]
MSVPTYRVRLFLSVDLTGSTAYKQKSGDNLKWIKVFQLFYGTFPKILSDEYDEACKHSPGIHKHEVETGHPKLWKTVGDEILFCAKVESACHLGACISAFIEALKIFGSTAKKHELNTKGNAWVASFPTPNCSISPVKVDAGVNNDSLNGKSDLPTEENEQSVDAQPSSFDFLGKGIDAGFRISKNSEIDTLTLSPGLGVLLAQAAGSHRSTGFKKSIRLVEMQIFKGVADSKPYPVLTIDTLRDELHESLLKKQRMLLKLPEPPGNDELELYLKDYLQYHEIEIPKIKQTYSEQIFDPPDFYVAYCDKWHAEMERLKAEDRRREEAAGADGEENGVSPPKSGDLDDVVESLPSKQPDGQHTSSS